MSGEAIEEAGHAWIGCDISKDMLALAAEKESDGGWVRRVGRKMARFWTREIVLRFMINEIEHLTPLIIFSSHPLLYK